ncbi:hypothetical protein BC828DRAFT_387389 [Blastocladiella britannica]|nr:hypothetical protein BC828DRAFT_387389 [Blastocladiella britannica]
MGKAKKVGGRRVASKSSGSSAPPSIPPAPIDATAILATARTSLDHGDPDAAISAASRVLAFDPSHLAALETLGIALLESGSPERAYDAFMAYHARDSANAAVELYLGQLAGGKPAVQHFQRAIEVLVAQHQQHVESGNGAGVGETVEKAVEAYCSVAELYMTDLCFEPEAEQTCLDVLHRAIALDPSNPNPYLTLASVEISRSRPSEARAALQQGLSVWLPALVAYLKQHAAAAASASASADDDNDNDTPPLEAAELAAEPPTIPAFDARIAAARLCVELGLYGRALDVLGVCAGEFDESVDVWYLMGWTYYLIGEAVSAAAAGTTPTVTVADVAVAVELPDADVMAARADAGRDVWWADAGECLGRALRFYAADGHDDTQLLAHVRELLAAITAAGVTLTLGEGEMEFGLTAGDEAGDDDDEQGNSEWEDMDV